MKRHLKTVMFVRDLRDNNSLKSLFSDHEIRMVLIWAIIGPLAVLSYLIWKKYPRFRLGSIPLFGISFAYFIGQWGGILYVIQKLLS